jgi:hypothetical protein
MPLSTLKPYEILFGIEKGTIVLLMWLNYRKKFIFVLAIFDKKYHLNLVKN